MSPFRSALPIAALALASCQQPDATSAPGTDAGTATAGALKIGHVNTDTILANYVYLKDQADILSRREQEASAALERKLRKFQDQVRSFQQRAQSGTMTPKQIESEQTALARIEQELAAEQQRLAVEFQGEGQRLQAELITVLKREVDALQAEGGYDFILSSGAGSGVLASNPTYDITAAVLARMNAAPAPEPDSASIRVDPEVH